jgi:glucose/arabinose dehydrogenase
MRRAWGICAAVAIALGAMAVGSGVVPTVPAGAADLSAVHVKLTPVSSGLSRPIAIAWRKGDNHMYVAEQTGHVRVLTSGRVVGTSLTLTDISNGGEQGLLGLTFSPDGTKMYVDYTDHNGDTRVAEYTMNGTTAVTSSRRQLLFEDQPYANHNGGEVTFGPDGKLYITLGDGGSAGDPNNVAQDLGSRLGKILRMDPHPHGNAPYTVPLDNPFVGVSGARPLIWMYGLRNPWRWSFDGTTGDVWIGDVGQDLYEEVDWAPASIRNSGVNWEWSLREGFHAYKGDPPPNGRDPIIERAHSLGDCAVIGGYVYRGTAIPDLQGAYVYGDLCTGVIRAAVQSGGAIVQSADLGINVSQLTSFARGPTGNLFALSLAGTIQRIDPA